MIGLHWLMGHTIILSVNREDSYAKKQIIVSN